MTDEMFQQLLTMVGSAGDGGFVLAVIFLLQGYFGSIVAIIIVALIMRLIRRLVVLFSFITKCGEACEFPHTADWSDYERQKLLSQIRRGQEALVIQRASSNA